MSSSDTHESEVAGTLKKYCKSARVFNQLVGTYSTRHNNPNSKKKKKSIPLDGKVEQYEVEVLMPDATSAPSAPTKSIHKLQCISVLKPRDDTLYYSQGWIIDACAAGCMSCNSPFSFFNRRHHCRKCGFLVCESCSPYRMAVAFISEPGGVSRVCISCNSTDLNSRNLNYSMDASPTAVRFPASEIPANSITSPTVQTAATIEPKSAVENNESIPSSAIEIEDSTKPEEVQQEPEPVPEASTTEHPVVVESVSVPEPTENVASVEEPIVPTTVDNTDQAAPEAKAEENSNDNVKPVESKEEVVIKTSLKQASSLSTSVPKGSILKDLKSSGMWERDSPSSDLSESPNPHHSSTATSHSPYSPVAATNLNDNNDFKTPVPTSKSKKQAKKKISTASSVNSATSDGNLIVGGVWEAESTPGSAYTSNTNASSANITPVDFNNTPQTVEGESADADILRTAKKTGVWEDNDDASTVKTGASSAFNTPTSPYDEQSTPQRKFSSASSVSEGNILKATRKSGVWEDMDDTSTIKTTDSPMSDFTASPMRTEDDEEDVEAEKQDN